MAVRIRLTRIGRKNRPFYRVGAFDARSRRDGAAIEYLGTYDPLNAKPEEQLRLDMERIRYWLSVGAQPSETVASMLGKADSVKEGSEPAPASPTATASEEEG